VRDTYRFWGVVYVVAAMLARVGPLYAARQHTHVHGVGQLNIVVDGTQATVELRAPAEAIYGFEHQARSKADEEKRAAALARLQEQIGTMVIFATDRGCQFTTQKIAVVEDGEHERAPGPGQGGQAKKSGEHSEVHAEFAVICDQPLAGSQVKFGISKIFPGIKTVRVQALSGAKQIGAEITGDKGSLTL
jgi:hypothetical protein